MSGAGGVEFDSFRSSFARCSNRMGKSLESLGVWFEWVSETVCWCIERAMTTMNEFRDPHTKRTCRMVAAYVYLALLY